VKVMRFACKITATSRDGERFMEGREEVGRENRKVLESQVARARACSNQLSPDFVLTRTSTLRSAKRCVGSANSLWNARKRDIMYISFCDFNSRLLKGISRKQTLSSNCNYI